jgi:predicted alpha/beta superfamily hydrolase
MIHRYSISKNIKVIFYLIFIISLLSNCKTPSSSPKTVDPILINNSENNSSEKISEYSIGIKHTIHSTFLQQDREIFIHVPQDFYGQNETKQKFPLAIVMDGDYLFLPTVSAIDQLSSPYLANIECPAMIVVGIPNIDRGTDLSPLTSDSNTTTETAGIELNNMGKFIEKELIPYLENTYPLVNNRTLIGHSLGGLFVADVLMHAPDLFNNYIIIDPDMSYDEGKFQQRVLTALEQRTPIAHSVFLAVANNAYSDMTLKELRKDTSEILRISRTSLDFIESLQEFDKTTLHVESKYYEDEDHFSIPHVAIIDGLKYIFDNHRFPYIIDYYKKENKPTIDIVTRLEEHFSSVSKVLGYIVLPPENYIDAWAGSYAYFGEPDIGRSLYEYNIKLYPDSPIVYSRKANFLLAQEDTIGAISMIKQSLSIAKNEELRQTLIDLSK